MICFANNSYRLRELSSFVFQRNFRTSAFVLKDFRVEELSYSKVNPSVWR